jgi:hypothetical protein
MTTLLPRCLAPASLVFALACDLALLPEAAQYEGTATPRLTLRVAGDAMPDPQVQAVDLELVDVLVHRESDDAWVWIGGGADRIELDATLVEPNLPVPLPADRYDAVLVVVDRPRVAHGGAWHNAVLGADEIEMPLDLDLVGDAGLELHFDLGKSLARSNADKWTFDPAAHAAIAP